MSKREQVTLLNVLNAFNLQAIASDTTTNGVIIDVSAYNAVTFAILAGLITLGTITPVIEEGDDPSLSDAAVVASDYLFYPEGETDAVFAAIDDYKAKRVGVITNKKYLRISLTTADSADLTVGAIAILGLSNIAAVGQS